MSADDFRAWRTRLDLTQADAAHALGLALSTDGRSSDAVRHYEAGRRKIPASIALLCRYVERYGSIA